jgi:hypothetical protein
MVVYEVNLDINTEIFEQFKQWLVEHMKKMMTFKGFLEAKLLAENSDNSAKKKLTACYLLDSRKSLDDYLAQHAPVMRQDGIDTFGNQFSATRRIFDVAEIVTAKN